MTVGTLLADLQAIVGEDVREARDEDAIDGVRPSWVVSPGNADETSAVMRLAFERDLAVVPRGAGTALSWGRPPARFDLVLNMRRMNRVLEHAAGDLVVRAEPGVSLRVLQDTVRPAGQMLAIDVLRDQATVGGIVASNVSGPRRFRYGTMRDLLIGITIVLADGTVARSGGKVVKNVAGYDLGKLLTGSFGTLGVIVETIFRLHALAVARQLVVLPLAQPRDLGPALQTVLHSDLTPTAVDLLWESGEGRLVLCLEGTAPGVDAGVERAAGLLKPFGSVEAVEGTAADDLWAAMTAYPWSEGEVGIKAVSIPTELPDLLASLLETSPATRVRGQAGMAVLYAALPAGEVTPETIRGLRERASASGGSLLLLQAPPDLKREVDPWGPLGDALPLMRRLKTQFDPHGLLSPGRFIEGIV